MVDGRKKGNNYENEVARILSGWLSSADDLTNYRTCPVSSLLFRRKPADNENIVTDWKGGRDLIHRPDIFFPFTVECKRIEESFELSSLFRYADIWKWYDQAVSQSVVDGGWPLLVFSKNRNPDFIILPEEAAQCLQLQPHDGPCLVVQRPKLFPVTLALLSDLARCEPRRLRSLGKPPRPLLALPRQLATSSGCLRARLRGSSRAH